MKIEVNQDWSEFLCALIDRRVRFVLVGGHAVSGHGEARLTEDLDVFVEASLANGKRLHAALADFGFAAVAPSAAILAEPDKVFMLGHKPWRIDILTGIDGVTFAQAWASRVEAGFLKRPLFVIGRDALIKNKRAAGRPKDLVDVAMLESLTDGSDGAASTVAPRAPGAKGPSTKSRRLGRSAAAAGPPPRTRRSRSGRRR
ncbi:MAG: hypothetical protein KBG28_15470 [Kofleriaceae bacterium]|nr:hypothetical protein [Kofleriaceae bacterium]